MSADVSSDGVLVAEQPIATKEEEEIMKKIEKNAEECPIALVTIFKDMCEVRRLVKFDADVAGHHDIIVRGITTQAKLESFRVLRGSGEATLLELFSQIKTVPSVDCSGSLEKMQAECDELNERIDELTRKIDACSSEINTVHGFASASEGSAVSQMKNETAVASFLSPEYIENARRFLSFIQNEVSDAASRRNTLIRERGELMDKLHGIESAIKGIKVESRKTKSILEVSVSCEVTKPGAVAFAMSYLVPNAHWETKYEFWVDSEKSKLSIKCAALIHNRTGEDWPSTDLVLSTANPEIGSAPPDRKTVIVSHDYSCDRDPPSLDSYGVIIPGDGNGPSTLALRTFELHSYNLIECTGVQHELTTLVINDVPMEHYYTVAPRASTDVFSIISAKNTSKHILLAGPVSMYVDGIFVCKSHLKPLAPEEAFEISLGTDKDIRVKYDRPSPYYLNEGVMMFKKTVQAYSGSISITNNKNDKAITIQVFDKLPLSSDKGIVVALTEKTLNDQFPPVITKDKNLLEWKFKLEAQKSVSLDVSFTVKYPEKRSVTFDW